MSLSFLLVTANVGSLFDENDAIEPFWESALFELIAKASPDFFALHLQEIGGKQYEKNIRKVALFIQKIYKNLSDQFQLSAGFSFLDEEVDSVEKFTALGCLYLVKRPIAENLFVWNFRSCNYERIPEIFETSDQSRFVQRIKFPIHFFPNFKWTRKGYAKSRWKLFDKELELVNIHLFHDACNLTAMQESPSVYCNSRREAFNHALSELKSENFNNHAGFIFGDFNFRLDGKELLKRLATGAGATELVNSTNGQTLSLCRKIADTQEELLTIGTKKFDHPSRNHLSHDLLVQFDKEARQFPQLSECKITFGPSYPFCEDVSQPTTLMKTRAPAWCDRVLMNQIAWELVSKSSQLRYDTNGQDVCTGDHKPVYLHFVTPISQWKAGGLLCGNARRETDTNSYTPTMEILPFSKEDLVDLLNHILCDRIVQAEPPMVLVYHSTVTSNQRTTEQRNSTSPHERILYVTVIKLEDLAVFIRDARRFALQPPWLISSKASMRVPMLTPFHLRFRTNELHQKIFQNQGDTKPVKETLKTAKEVNANALQRRLSRSSMNLHDFNEFHLRFVVGNSSLPPSSQSTPELRRQTPQPKRPDSRAEHFSEAAAAGAQYITLRDQWGQPEVVYAKKSWISSWERQKKAEQIAATGSSVIQQQRKTKKPTKGVQTDPSRTGDPNTLGLEKVAKKRLKSFGYFGIDHPVVIREGVEIDNKQKKSPL